MSAGPASWISPEDLVGKTLEGRYRVIRLLGVGGMGAVYEGRHARLDKRVAIKVLNPGLAIQETQRKRFLREARAANRIDHKNVIDILDFGEDPVTFFVMEYLEGRDLDAVLAAEGPLPWPRAKRLLMPVLRALAAAHAKGIVHRDMKPANCFLLRDEDGQESRIKVLDFGIAKVAESSPETHGLTKTNEMMGTVAYMAPEQVTTEPVDVRTDVYAVGVMLYQMLTGKVPFEGSNAFQVLDQHVRTQPRAPRELNPAIPIAVEAAVLQAVAKNPEQRFQSMDEFAAFVEGIESGPGPLPHPTAFLGDVQRPHAPSHPTPATQVLPDTTGPSAGRTDLISAPSETPTAMADRAALGRTEPTMFGEEPRTKRSLAWLAIGGVLFVAAGAGVGWALTGNSERDVEDLEVVSHAETKTGAAAETPKLEASPTPAVPEAAAVEDKAEAPGVVPSTPVAPTAEEPQPDAPPPASPAADERTPPRTTPKKRPVRPKTATSDPPADAMAEAMGKLRRKARSSCREGVFGGTVTVVFHVKPSGGTVLVKPQSPNDRSAAGECVAGLVRAGRFPASSAGRHKLTVRY